MSANEEDKIDKLIAQVDKMNRGLYGDEENKQKGLMQIVYDNVEEVNKLKESEKKRNWILAGATFVLSLFSPFVVEWFKAKFGL